jgi:SPP1 family predicted phage head-tail adaptor
MPYGAKRTSIGKRRERITIRQRVTTDDGLGGQLELRKKIVAEPWAKVEALDERTHEAVAGSQLTARHGYLLEIPYQASITPRLIVNVRGTTMEIHTVADDEGLRRRLVLHVREVQ